MKKGLVINEGVWPLIDELLPIEKADLLSALSAYYKGEEIPDANRIVTMVLNRIASDNARFDPENKKTLSEIRAEAGRKGAEARWQNVANIANDGKNGNLPQDKDKDIDIDKDKDKKGKPKPFRELFNDSPSLLQDFVEDAWRDWLEVRKRKNVPWTARAAVLNANTLKKLSGGDPIKAVKILEQSTENGWQGLFELKGTQTKKSKINWEVI